LTLSDLELGRTALRRVPTALDHVIDAAIEVLREKAGQAQVEIRRECAADLPALDADPDRIEQVLVNLLDNAVKYTRPGGRVTVGARITEPLHEQGSREWIELSVADTGVGVPKRDLPRLTERFYRVDKARSRELGGTGLGLAIVKHIVQAHGGALRIDSDLGRGTCVHVYLPAADSPPNLGAPERS
jgi:two-component system phosphate regulon sensor histidine kinase PhoR